MAVSRVSETAYGLLYETMLRRTYNEYKTLSRHDLGCPQRTKKLYRSPSLELNAQLRGITTF
jgi:hypothetical protein